MRNRQTTRWILSVLCVVLAVGIGWASPDRKSAIPDFLFARGLDETPVTVWNQADNTTWAVWSYRNGGEFDIALAVLDDSGSWSEPLFFGEDDGLDQHTPTLAFDGNGTAYLAYAVSGQIFLYIDLAGRGSWFGPIPMDSITEPAGSPMLRVVGNKLVLAVISNGAIAIVEMDLVNPPAANTTKGIQEGPDAIDPLGMTRDVDGAEESEPTEGELHRRGSSESRGARPTNIRSDSKAR